jgi:hypothetical protein
MQGVRTWGPQAVTQGTPCVLPQTTMPPVAAVVNKTKLLITRRGHQIYNVKKVLIKIYLTSSSVDEVSCAAGAGDDAAPHVQTSAAADLAASA